MLNTSDTTQINQLSYVSYDLYIVNKCMYMHNIYLFAWPDQPQYSPFAWPDQPQHSPFAWPDQPQHSAFAWPDQPQYSPFIAAANESINYNTNKHLTKRFPCRNGRIEDGRNSYVCKLKSILTYILRRLDNCTAYWSIFQLGVIGWHVDFYLWLNNNYLRMADYTTGLEQSSIFSTDGTSIIYWPIQMYAPIPSYCVLFP